MNCDSAKRVAARLNMASMNTQKIIDFINASELEAVQKLAWATRVETEGITAQVLAGLKVTFQAKINELFKEMEVDITNLAKYKKEEERLDKAVQSAGQAYKKTLDQIDREMKKVQTDAVKMLDQAQAAAVKRAV